VWFVVFSLLIDYASVCAVWFIHANRILSVLRVPCFQFSQNKRIFSDPTLPDQPRGSTSLLYSEYQRYFLERIAAGA
jgi:hypothetical protein